MTLKDLANGIGNLFNGVGQAVQNMPLPNPINPGMQLPSINQIRQTIPQVQQASQQAMRIASSVPSYVESQPITHVNTGVPDLLISPYRPSPKGQEWLNRNIRPLTTNVDVGNVLRPFIPALPAGVLPTINIPTGNIIANRLTESAQSKQLNDDAAYLAAKYPQLRFDASIPYGQQVAMLKTLPPEDQARVKRINAFKNQHLQDTAMGTLNGFHANVAGLDRATQALRVEGQQLLEAMPKEVRLAHALNYSNELVKRGFTAGQVEQIGAAEGASILKNGITPLQRFGATARITASKTAQAGEDFIQSLSRDVRNANDPYQTAQTVDNAIRNINVKQKVNIFDYLRTPEYVLQKIGLGKHAQELRTAYDKYQAELPVEIQRITEWSKRVSPEANTRIFQYLDGQRGIKLAPHELEVAGEIKGYLNTWADKLGLPKDSRITSYITHIFPIDALKKEFDPEIASLIRDKVAGSVYDPFLLQRQGKTGYLEDTWQALDAYVKRAVRKYNVDPVLEKISRASQGLEDSQFNYVKSYIDRVNMRPTAIDDLIDNAIKSSPIGYRFGQRPVTVITQRARQMVYRGLLGLNPGAALKNLSQGANTYAKLGEKYTVVGYAKAVQNLPKFLAGQDTELNQAGVLHGIVEDRTLSATKKFWEKTDSGLFYLFNLAEDINRGAAYWGAKAKGIAKGMSEEEAMQYAKQVVRETQFTFDRVDTPLAFSSDLAKTLGQFQSYSLKQGEFLTNMLKQKDIAGLVRYTAASLLFIDTIGKAFGMKWSDLIPSVRVGTPPTLQGPYGAYQVATGQPDQYGNPAKPNLIERALQNQNLVKGAMNYVPAGGQLLKGFKGYGDVARGYSVTQAGNVRYPVDQNWQNYLRGTLFGASNLPEAQSYYDGQQSPLSKKQSALFKTQTPGEQLGTYQKVLEDRKAQATIDAAKGLVEQTGKDTTINGTHFLYLDKNGKVQQIDERFQPTEPKLTGNELVDKHLISKYRGEITQKENDILTLFEHGQLNAQEAESQLNTLKATRDKLTKPKVARAKKPKKVISYIAKSTPVKGLKVSQAKRPKFKLASTSIYKTSNPARIKGLVQAKPYEPGKIATRRSPRNLRELTNTLFT